MSAKWKAALNLFIWGITFTVAEYIVPEIWKVPVVFGGGVLVGIILMVERVEMVDE